MEIWVVGAVHRVGVRAEFGETGSSSWMTFLTGGDNVVGCKMRCRIAARQDIVVAVAVVASGNILGLVCLAQGHGLAVIGLAIVVEAVLVALATTLVAGRFEMREARPLDLMRAVAIRTDRPASVALGKELSMNAFIVDLLDAKVTFSAGVGDVLVMN